MVSCHNVKIDPNVLKLLITNILIAPSYEADKNFMLVSLHHHWPLQVFNCNTDGKREYEMH